MGDGDGAWKVLQGTERLELSGRIVEPSESNGVGDAVKLAQGTEYKNRLV